MGTESYVTNAGIEAEDLSERNPRQMLEDFLVTDSEDDPDMPMNIIINDGKNEMSWYQALYKDSDTKVVLRKKTATRERSYGTLDSKFVFEEMSIDDILERYGRVVIDRMATSLAKVRERASATSQN